MGTDTTVLVPPRRLGTLLRQARTATGATLDEFAAQTDLTVVELDDLEQGRRAVDDELLTRLLALYGVEDAGLMPDRSQLVIDLNEGRVAIHDAEATEGLIPSATTAPDLVLARYLALVYRLRELPLGSPLSLRDLDLEVLSTALSIETADVERRLRRLMADEETIEEDQRRIRRRLLLPLVGVVIAATGVGTLLLVAENGSDSDPSPVQTEVVDAGTARVADAAVVDAPATTPSIGDAAVADPPDVPTEIGDPALDGYGDITP